LKNFSGEKKKEITFILGGLTAGGAERVASSLIKLWINQGNKVNLITKKSRDRDFYEIPESVNRICLGGEGASRNKWIGLLKNVWYVIRLRKTLKTMNSDVLISFLTRQNIYAILASIGFQSRVIISERNDTTRQKQDWPWGKLREKIYKYADLVTANSEVALKGMKPYVEENKLVLVPNPVFIPQERAKPSHSKHIISVGRLEKVKNHNIVIEAFFKSGLYNKGWILDIFGIGPLEANLKQQVLDLNLDENVKFHGLVKNLGEHYQKSAMLILASDYEGTPNALLEAMSYGIPGIVSNELPGALKIIEHKKNGLVFNKGDTNQLSEQIKYLAEPPSKTNAIGKLARESVKKFSSDVVIQQWNALL